jgi:protein-tyrosine phosphatase
MVCTENICRSPLAEGLLRHHIQSSGLRGWVKVSSAGTRASMPGRRPDQRAQKVAAAAAVDLGRIRASKVTVHDLERSDYIFAMDRTNVRDLRLLCPPEHQHKISLLLHHLASSKMDDVPDPYYGSVEGFKDVFLLIDAAVLGVVAQLDNHDRSL